MWCAPVVTSINCDNKLLIIEEANVGFYKVKGFVEIILQIYGSWV